MIKKKKVVKKIWVKVVTPEEKVFEGAADFISIPAKSGSMGILPEHLPIISLLKIGILKVFNEGKIIYIGVCRGYVEFFAGRAIILTERAIITTEEEIEETIEELKKKHDITQEITEETRKVIEAIVKLKTLRK